MPLNPYILNSQMSLFFSYRLPLAVTKVEWVFSLPLAAAAYPMDFYIFSYRLPLAVGIKVAATAPRPTDQGSRGAPTRQGPTVHGPRASGLKGPRASGLKGPRA